MSDQTDLPCLTTWYNPITVSHTSPDWKPVTNHGNAYMYPHDCRKPDGHSGRHTCSMPGCRSWRKEADDEQ